MMSIASSYYRRSDCSAICSEMDRLAGGHYFSAVRSCECDSEGYWKYYVEQVFSCPGLKFSDVSSLEHQAVMNLQSSGVLVA